MPYVLNASAAGQCVGRATKIAEDLRAGPAAEHGRILFGTLNVCAGDRTTSVPLEGNEDDKNCLHCVVVVSPGGSPKASELIVCDPTYDPLAMKDPLGRLVSMKRYIQAYLELLDTEQVKPDVVFVNLRKRDNEGIIPCDVPLFFTPGGDPC